MFKKAKVVMLPTNEANSLSKTQIVKSGNEIFISDNIFTYDQAKLDRLDKSVHDYKPQHLYFLSDEEIGIKQWFYEPEEKTVFFNELYLSSQVRESFPKALKIIASTDSLLAGLVDQENNKFIYLSRPSDSFIKKYCELGGINEVMVEYNEYRAILGVDIDDNSKINYSDPYYDLKVAPDNTITIKAVKDSWNKEEVTNIADDAFSAGISYALSRGLNKPFKEWIEENL